MGLCWLQVGQALTKPLVSFPREDHQNGHWTTSSTGDMNRQLGGHELGPGWSWMEALTLSSTSQVIVATKREGGRMVSGPADSTTSSGRCRDRASGLMLAGPRPVREGKFKSGEEERPASLPGVKTSGGLDIFQVLVICL